MGRREAFNHPLHTFRQVMMEAPMAATFKGAPAEVIDNLTTDGRVV